MEEKPSLLKPAMNYGVMAGVVSIALNLVFYLLDITDTTITSVVSVAVSTGIVFYIQNHYKTNALGGYMTYSQGLGIGTLSMLFGAIISAFYLYIFLSFVDAAQIDVAMEQAYNDMVEQGMEESQIDQAMEMTSMFMTPGMFAIFGFLGGSFFGFIISLITSIFTKKQDPSVIE